MPDTASFRIQSLDRDDTAVMRELLTLFGDVFEEADTYCASQPSDAYLRRLLGKEDFFALVAVEGSKVVGGLTAYQHDKYEQERREIYIYDLAVSAAHRRKGIATALIETLRSMAAERGVYLLIVQADYGDDPAIALYTKLGAREDILHFDIRVS